MISSYLAHVIKWVIATPINMSRYFSKHALLIVAHIKESIADEKFNDLNL